MSPRDFVYWLQGFSELSQSDRPSEEQWETIIDHLQLVFDKQTPDRYQGQGIDNSDLIQINDMLHNNGTGGPSNGNLIC